MKYFYYLCYIVVLSSCVTSKQTFIPTSGAFTYGIDLTKYANEGFLITPFEYRGDYLTVGIFTTEIIPEINQLNATKLSKDQAYGYQIRDGFTKKLVMTPDFFYYVLEVSEVDLKEVIEKSYQFVKSVGGDAIMEFSIITETRDGKIDGNTYQYSVNSVKGIAIKRQD